MYLVSMQKPIETSKSLIVKVPSHQHRTLRLLAAANETTMTDLVRGAIDRLLAEQEEQAKVKSA